jgi:hypothetical protein
MQEHFSHERSLCEAPMHVGFPTWQAFLHDIAASIG